MSIVTFYAAFVDGRPVQFSVFSVRDADQWVARDPNRRCVKDTTGWVVAGKGKRG